MKKIAIVGTRPPVSNDDETRNREYKAIIEDVRDFIFKLSVSEVEIVSGGALGVDIEAECVANDWGFKFSKYLPEYDRFGSYAPLHRNKKIVEASSEVHAWPSTWSRGTWHTITEAKRLNKPVFVHEPFKRS